MSLEPNIRLIQLTDTHIVSDPDTQLLGIDTYKSLDLVLNNAMVLKPASEIFW